MGCPWTRDAGEGVGEMEMAFVAVQAWLVGLFAKLFVSARRSLLAIAVVRMGLLISFYSSATSLGAGNACSSSGLQWAGVALPMPVLAYTGSML